MKLLVVIDYINLFQFEKDYIAYDDNDESEEFNVKDLVKDILLWLHVRFVIYIYIYILYM